MQKIYICSIFCLIFYSSIFAQNIDSIYTKVQLNNYITSTLTTGIYVSESRRWVSQKIIFQNSYIQEYDTIEIVEKKALLFRKKKKALFIKNKKVTNRYLEEIPINSFELEDTLSRLKKPCSLNKYFWKINPSPILLSCDIQNIEIVEKGERLYILKIKISDDFAYKLKKSLAKNYKSIFVIIINNKIAKIFSYRDINFNNNSPGLKSIELEFKNSDKEKLEYIKTELIKYQQ